MNLANKQNEFTKRLVRLLSWLLENNYEVTLGEAFRPEWVAKEYASKGKGIVNSLHTKRLAIDLNLFSNGVFLVTKDDYKNAGEFWESLSTDEFKCVWGGRFTPPDSDHFSIAHEGTF